ncbi:hypothetical protein SNE40_000441 [Patella caerulea]|uniref:Amino acid transporter n=1 Tax=Patella caerulea TaxID=87958 RepID=A0AAN8Q717_PATCE
MDVEENQSLNNSTITKPGKCISYFKNNMLMWLNIVGIILGLVVGFSIRPLHPSKDALLWIGLPGELFLRMLKMLILPLIVCSVISGSATLDPKVNGKISLIALVYILVTHVIACSIGVVLSIVIKPGVGDTINDGFYKNENMLQTQDIFVDLLRNLFPNNMVEATFQQAQTKYSKMSETVIRNTSEGLVTENMVTVTKSNGHTGGINVLGLITISAIFGIAVSRVKEKATIFLQFFTGATEVILIILRRFFWAGPIGIASLIAASIAPVENMAQVFSQLGWFVLCCVVGIILHQFLVIPVIYVVIVRRNPYKYMLSHIKAILLGFASTSTAVAIPDMFVSCDNNKIDKRVSRFVIPFCVTLNADGSVIYITCATVFIIQLTLGTVTPAQAGIVIFLTSIIGTAIPSVPSASIVSLIIILTSLNIPIHQVALLFAVEWFLDRIRTQCNVASHTTCAAITYRICRHNLKTIDTNMDIII